MLKFVLAVPLALPLALPFVALAAADSVPSLDVTSSCKGAARAGSSGATSVRLGAGILDEP